MNKVVSVLTAGIVAGTALFPVGAIAQAIGTEDSNSLNAILGTWCNAEQAAKIPVGLVKFEPEMTDQLFRDAGSRNAAKSVPLSKLELPSRATAIEVFEIQKDFGQSTLIKKMAPLGEPWEAFDPSAKNQTSKPDQVAVKLSIGGSFGSTEAAWFWMTASQAEPLGGAAQDQWRLMIASTTVCDMTESGPAAKDDPVPLAKEGTAEPPADIDDTTADTSVDTDQISTEGLQKTHLFNIQSATLVLSTPMIDFIDRADGNLTFVEVDFEVDTNTLEKLKFETDLTLLEVLSELSPTIFAESPLQLSFREHEFTTPMQLTAAQLTAAKVSFATNSTQDGRTPLAVSWQPLSFTETADGIEVNAKMIVVPLPYSKRPKIPSAIASDDTPDTSEDVRGEADEVTPVAPKPVPVQTLSRVDLSLTTLVLGKQNLSLTNQFLRECDFTLYNKGEELFKLERLNDRTDDTVAKTGLSIAPEDLIGWVSLALGLSDSNTGQRCPLAGARIPASMASEGAQLLSATADQAETSDIVPYRLTIEAVAPADRPAFLALFAYPSIQQFNQNSTILAYLQMIASSTLALNTYYETRSSNFSGVRSGFVVNTNTGPTPIVFKGFPTADGIPAFTRQMWTNVRSGYSNSATYALQDAAPLSIGAALASIRGNPVEWDSSGMASPVPADKVLIVDMVANTAAAEARCGVNSLTINAEVQGNPAAQIARLTIIAEAAPFELGALKIDEAKSTARCTGPDAPERESFVWIDPANKTQTKEIVDGWATIFDDILVDIFKR